MKYIREHDGQRKNYLQNGTVSESESQSQIEDKEEIAHNHDIRTEFELDQKQNRKRKEKQRTTAIRSKELLFLQMERMDQREIVFGIII